ncbi:MAG: tetratricopeptide repeat protein [bacterium]|nr:tetratricopeptide repeat protein [bacterium]
MKTRVLFLSRWSYYSLMLVLFGGIVCFLLFTFRGFSAFVLYEIFQEQQAMGVEHGRQMERLQSAIRNDPDHAEYRFASGRLLLQKAIEEDRLSPALFEKAERRLHEAIRRDPANPYYYYELGRLGTYREEDLSATARYFRAALRNAPKELVLRQEVGRWFAAYDREAAVRLTRQLLDDDRQSLKLISSNHLRAFLYEERMDYESDLVLEGYPHLLQACPDESLQESPAEQTREIRHDDGKGEWAAVLVSEHDRIKKTFCLPANAERYKSAALKLFMHRAVDSKFSLILGIDKHTISLESEWISEDPGWHEIPFDPVFLRGNARIYVYIRVKKTSLRFPPALYVGGDRDAQNRYSAFLLKSQDDLSSEKGMQKGEYMIRLLLSN